MKRSINAVLAMTLGTLAGEAQVFSVRPAAGGIPDGLSAGWTSSIEISGLPNHLTEVRVRLQLEPEVGGGFVGDLYATLQQGDSFSVLMNRLGASPERPGGYGDSQAIDVLLSDAGLADIHDYRMELSGNAAVPLTAPLTGDWQPDGRASDPGGEVWNAPRTAMLSQFIGVNPNGLWTLFVADLSVGGGYRVTGWDLHMTVIPEVESGAFAAGGALLLWGWFRRSGNRRGNRD